MFRGRNNNFIKRSLGGKKLDFGYKGTGGKKSTGGKKTGADQYRNIGTFKSTGDPKKDMAVGKQKKKSMAAAKMDAQAKEDHRQMEIERNEKFTRGKVRKNRYPLAAKGRRWGFKNRLLSFFCMLKYFPHYKFTFSNFIFIYFSNKQIPRRQDRWQNRRQSRWQAPRRQSHQGRRQGCLKKVKNIIL